MSEAHKLSEGLKAVPKTIPCSFLYDSRGSMLYDKVCTFDTLRSDHS